jgi:hypothetical protein
MTTTVRGVAEEEAGAVVKEIVSLQNANEKANSQRHNERKSIRFFMKKKYLTRSSDIKNKESACNLHLHTIFI